MCFPLFSTAYWRFMTKQNRIKYLVCCSVHFLSIELYRRSNELEFENGFVWLVLGCHFGVITCITSFLKENQNNYVFPVNLRAVFSRFPFTQAKLFFDYNVFQNMYVNCSHRVITSNAINIFSSFARHRKFLHTNKLWVLTMNNTHLKLFYVGQ